MKELTEVTIQSEQLLDGKLLRVFRDRVELPDGSETIREWIDHPGASAVVPLFEDGTTLLVRQFRYPSHRTFLEVPAGKIDEPGENPQEVGARELEEETGWCARRFISLGSLYPCIGYSNEVIHLFIAEQLERGERALADGEFMEVVPIGFAEALELVRSGEIVDMKTVVALMFTHAHLAMRDDLVEGKKLR